MLIERRPLGNADRAVSWREWRRQMRTVIAGIWTIESSRVVDYFFSFFLNRDGHRRVRRFCGPNETPTLLSFFLAFFLSFYCSPGFYGFSLVAFSEFVSPSAQRLHRILVTQWRLPQKLPEKFQKRRRVFEYSATPRDVPGVSKIGLFFSFFGGPRVESFAVESVSIDSTEYLANNSGPGKKNADDEDDEGQPKPNCGAILQRSRQKRKEIEHLGEMDAMDARWRPTKRQFQFEEKKNILTDFYRVFLSLFVFNSENEGFTDGLSRIHGVLQRFINFLSLKWRSLGFS